MVKPEGVSKLEKEFIIKRFDLFSPTDYRYPVEELVPYLSERAYTERKAKVEAALTRTLEEYKVCPKGTADEIKKAVKNIEKLKAEILS